MTAREKEIQEKVVGLLRRYLNPKKIYLFGSRAKGIHRPGSDFDFAVDCEKPSDDQRREIEGMIEAVSGLYTVDVVYLPQVDDDFRDVILKTGRVLYEQR